MVKSQRPHKSVIAAAWCLSLVLAVGGAVNLGAAVLCVGFDGHVDVEYLLAGCCISSPSSLDQPAPAVIVTDGPGCGACVDLEVGDPILKSEKQRNPAPEVGVVNDFSRRYVRETEGLRPLLADRFDHQSSVLAPLSTIILLI